jgi:hypothetical protein
MTLQVFAPQQVWRSQVLARLGDGSIATNATTGFFYIPSCAGVPTGVPAVQAGMIPMVVDSTDGTIYYYVNGSWMAA